MSDANCPLCNQPLTSAAALRELQPPRLDASGVPWACSVLPGLGLPVVQPGRWSVMLDGMPVKRCVAFNRDAGMIWHYPEGPDGQPMRNGDRLHIERLSGRVTVRRLQSSKQESR